MNSTNKLKVFWLKHKVLVVVVATLVAVGAVTGGVLLSKGEAKPAQVINGLNEEKSQVLVTGQNYTMNYDADENEDDSDDKVDNKKDSDKKDEEEKKNEDPPEKEDDNVNEPPPEQQQMQNQQDAQQVQNESQENNNKDDKESSDSQKGDTGKGSNTGNTGHGSGHGFGTGHGSGFGTGIGSGSGSGGGHGSTSGSGSGGKDNNKEDKDEDSIIIDCDLKDGGTYPEKVKFSVICKYSKGGTISPFNYTVTMNGSDQRLSAQNSTTPAIYRETFEDGENTVKIYVKGKGGLTAEKVIKFNVDAKKEKKKIGKAHVKIDITRLVKYADRDGTLVDTTVMIHDGDSVVDILNKAMEGTGIDPDFDYKKNVYLKGVSMPGMLSGLVHVDEDNRKTLDEAFEENLEKAGLTLNGNYDPNSLREFSFTQTAGWLYTLDGAMPTEGLSQVFPKGGSVIHLYFDPTPNLSGLGG